VKHRYLLQVALLALTFSTALESTADNFDNRIKAIEEERCAIMDQEKSLLEQNDFLEKREFEIKAQMALLDKELNFTHVKLVETRHALITVQMKLH
jgi:hypothetical protein